MQKATKEGEERFYEDMPHTYRDHYAGPHTVDVRAYERRSSSIQAFCFATTTMAVYQKSLNLEFHLTTSRIQKHTHTHVKVKMLF